MKASIVIPSYNAEERLTLNLLALNRQDYCGDGVEVIVVDNGSDDKTMDLLQNFKLKYPLTAIRIEQNRGIANARNQGIAKARGDILIFHDSDMIAPKNFISKHLAAHVDENTVVCGLFWKRIYTYYYRDFDNERLKHLKTFLPEGENLKFEDKALINPHFKKMSYQELERFSFELENDFVLGAKEILRKYDGSLESYVMPWRFFITNNLSVPRQKVLDVGMLDDNIVRYGFEDYDLGYRLYKAGCRFMFAEDIASLHQEHTQNRNYLDALENIDYICCKYDHIDYIDIHLTCLAGCLQLDGNMLDLIVEEIKCFTDHGRYELLLELYLSLIHVIRRKCLKRQESDSVAQFLRIAEDMPRIVPEAVALRQTHEADTFINHLCLLLRLLYNINLDEILGVL